MAERSVVGREIVYENDAGSVAVGVIEGSMDSLLFVRPFEGEEDRFRPVTVRSQGGLVAVRRYRLRDYGMEIA